MPGNNLYATVMETLFRERYTPGTTSVCFSRDDIMNCATALGGRIRNLGDFVYSFRYRTALPEFIAANAPEGQEWIIRSAGPGNYDLVLDPVFTVEPDLTLEARKIMNATPGIVLKYAISDEQALLTRLRYNRLIDTFLGVSCYSLQNHLRTQINRVQIETDELYVGIDKDAKHYVIPVQAKGGRDRLGRIQIEHDILMCAEKFPDLICRPVAAQFLPGNMIALMELRMTEDGIRKVLEKHYRLVDPEQMTGEIIRNYNA
jgi:hypothetical protein